MKSRFKTNYNLSNFPKYEGEKDFGPSLTDPTGYQTIDQIIERCRRGVPLNVATHVPEYEFSDDLSDEQIEGIMDSVSRGVEDPDFDLADVPGLKNFLELKNTPKHEEDVTSVPSECDSDGSVEEKKDE